MSKDKPFGINIVAGPGNHGGYWDFEPSITLDPEEQYMLACDYTLLGQPLGYVHEFLVYDHAARTLKVINATLIAKARNDDGPMIWRIED